MLTSRVLIYRRQRNAARIASEAAWPSIDGQSSLSGMGVLIGRRPALVEVHGSRRKRNDAFLTEFLSFYGVW